MTLDAPAATLAIPMATASEIARFREEVPLALERLRDDNPDGYAWVTDVFSEVLYQLRRNEVKDPQMIDWLMESIEYHTRRCRERLDSSC